MPARQFIITVLLLGLTGVTGWQPALAETTSTTPIGSDESGSASTGGHEKPGTVQSRDEIWFVSARSVNCETTDLSKLKIEVFRDGCWTSSSLSELLQLHQDDAIGETVLYVHGNRTDEYSAKHRGRQVFRNLFVCCPSPRPPIRFVIWAWDSDRTGHGMTDFCIKSQRAVRLGAIFSATVDAFGSVNPPLIVGYSLGCQIIAKAFTDNDLSEKQAEYRVAMIVPVMECRFSSQFCRNSCRSKSIVRSIVFVNYKDIVSCLAQRICIRQSAGNFRSVEQWAQMPDQPLGNNQLVNISRASSCQHSVIKYTSVSHVRRNIGFLLEENAQPASDPNDSWLCRLQQAHLPSYAPF